MWNNLLKLGELKESRLELNTFTYDTMLNHHLSQKTSGDLTWYILKAFKTSGHLIWYILNT